MCWLVSCRNDVGLTQALEELHPILSITSLDNWMWKCWITNVVV